MSPLLRTFWSSSPRGVAQLPIVCLPATPLPHPYTRVNVSSMIFLWSSCNTPRSLRAYLFTVLRCRPLPSKRFAGTLSRLSSCVAERTLLLVISGNRMYCTCWTSVASSSLISRMLVGMRRQVPYFGVCVYPDLATPSTLKFLSVRPSH